MTDDSTQIDGSRYREMAWHWMDQVTEVTQENKRLARQLRTARERIAELEAKQQAPSRSTNGTIYAVRSGGLIKIGWSSDLDKRMRQYPPDTMLLAAMPGTMGDERKIHKRLRVHLAYGNEWFAMTPTVMQSVQSMVDKHGEPEQPRWAARPVEIPRPHQAKEFSASRYGSRPVAS